LSGDHHSPRVGPVTLDNFWLVRPKPERSSQKDSPAGATNTRAADLWTRRIEADPTVQMQPAQAKSVLPVVLLGCGGVGSHLLRHIVSCRPLHANQVRPSFIPTPPPLSFPSPNRRRSYMLAASDDRASPSGWWASPTAPHCSSPTTSGPAASMTRSSATSARPSPQARPYPRCSLAVCVVSYYRWEFGCIRIVSIFDA
jgi:hypothetical protein